MLLPVKHIFRAYDIRGRVPAELNPQICNLLGSALAACSHARDLRQWTLGYDGRLSSPELAVALAGGLAAGGAEVTDIGLVPTPLLYYATCRQEQQCGVMLTGSHNPVDYNGLKIMLDGEAMAGDQITDLYRRISTGDLASGSGSVCRQDFSAAYIRAALAACQPLKRPLRLVIDAGNGAAGKIAPELYRALGCEVVELFCDIDGTFPNHHPDPGKIENLQHLIAAIAQHKADIGFAFDGDGDRLGIVTNQGEVIFPDRALMLLAEDLLARHPHSTILMDVKCSPLVFQHIAAAGGRPQLAPSGHSLIKRAMKREAALLAGEMSGHMFFAEDWNGCDDALLAGVRLLTLISHFRGSSSELFADYPAWLGTAEINLTSSESRKWEIIQELQQHGEFGNGKLIDIDGIRIEYAHSWGLIRCSNTTPTLVLRFEGKTSAHLSTTIQHFAKQLAGVAPELDISPLHQAYSEALTNHAD